MDVRHLTSTNAAQNDKWPCFSAPLVFWHIYDPFDTTRYGSLFQKISLISHELVAILHQHGHTDTGHTWQILKKHTKHNDMERSVISNKTRLNNRSVYASKISNITITITPI